MRYSSGKTVYFTTGLLAILGLTVWGCGEDSNPVEVVDRDGSVLVTGATVTLMPTGNSTQDTENLQAAIHDSSLDAGGTLYLGPGTFLVHASLVRQTNDPTGFGYNPVPFNGTIQGAGKGLTIIRSVRGSGGASFTPFYYELFDTAWPSTFFILDEDYLGVRDMTFEADSEIADLWWWHGIVPTKGLLNYVTAGSGLFGVGNQIGTDCVNVHFKGSLDSSGKPETIHMFEPWGGRRRHP